MRSPLPAGRRLPCAQAGRMAIMKMPEAAAACAALLKQLQRTR